MEAFQVNRPGHMGLDGGMPRLGASVAARVPRTRGVPSWRAGAGGRARVGRVLMHGRVHGCGSWKAPLKIASCSLPRGRSVRSRKSLHAGFRQMATLGDKEGKMVEVRVATGTVPELEGVRELGWETGFSERYDLSDELLGEGSFGKVWQATDKSTGIAVAVKVLPKNRGDDWEKYAGLLRNEVGNRQHKPGVDGMFP